eukprot:Opistho-1_new@6218
MRPPTASSLPLRRITSPSSTCLRQRRRQLSSTRHPFAQQRFQRPARRMSACAGMVALWPWAVGTAASASLACAPSKRSPCSRPTTPPSTASTFRHRLRLETTSRAYTSPAVQRTRKSACGISTTSKHRSSSPSAPAHAVIAHVTHTSRQNASVSASQSTIGRSFHVYASSTGFWHATRRRKGKRIPRRTRPIARTNAHAHTRLRHTQRGSGLGGLLGSALLGNCLLHAEDLIPALLALLLRLLDKLVEPLDFRVDVLQPPLDAALGLRQVLLDERRAHQPKDLRVVLEKLHLLKHKLVLVELHLHLLACICVFLQLLVNGPQCVDLVFVLLVRHFRRRKQAKKR